MKIHSGEQPTMSREEMADDYLRLKLEYTRLHEDYRRLQIEKDKQLSISRVSGSISVEDTVNAFLDWMKSDDCWINDKDDKRIPDAVIDGKNFIKYAEKYYR